MKKFKIIISGGGTGGHIFPAIAIAKAFEKKINNIEILFVGAKGRMEMEKIPILGYHIKGLWISGFQRSMDYRNLFFPFKLLISLIKSIFIIRKYNPDLVIGTGGYASGPLLYASTLFNIPSLIQEQNSYPGITNRILGNYANKICVAYDGMEKYFDQKKLFLTGNPIRSDIIKFKQNIDHRSIFNFNNNNPTLLVIGGSLGALSINNAIYNNIECIKESKINLIWQTGKSYEDRVSKDLFKKDNTIIVKTFINDMHLAYNAADIIISRAGAIAISELCYVGKPTILVPSPNVAENHQYKNAQSLVNKNAALLVEDKDTNIKLVNVLVDLIKNKKLQKSLSINIKKLSIDDAAKKIVDIALNMLK
tara:strand:- start:796 stop:1890 length:1095 start_codon:yes stop_codon:yes gene_type:complete